ncbi:YgfZ/GcvT domain-containing protein [Aestuariivirga litoralis]|uniref:CAF17-like 4Fe-4S cluster assembly/insertion protein YgfZ n=1 Tax=Aestuariivirga litoralis TaxID=2650924 RepID=UPI0018C7502A|nr:folate-binding protein YgfZ [Aestuariivirga litoralis]MBG1230830.1 folate-binding protein YgfZ [Aestuariivirga litoralis]
MTEFTPESLPHRAITALKGDGVLAFLHNILTCDVENLIQGQIAYGALLSPQGKILHDVFIHHAGDVSYLDGDASARDDLVAKLKLYRLRAKFEITPRDDLGVLAFSGAALDPRHALLGTRAIADIRGHASGHNYDLNRYALGIADSAEIGSNKLFPHEANFDQFAGVDFKKGCYIGQEVVSRMHHRGTARSRILPITFEDENAADEIRVGEMLLGEVLGRRGKAALALLRLDRLAEAKASLPFKVSKPDWARFEVTLP